MAYLISPFLSENVLTSGYPIKTILEVHVLQYTSPVIFQWTRVMYTHIQTHTYVYFYTGDGGKLKKNLSRLFPLTTCKIVLVFSVKTIAVTVAFVFVRNANAWPVAQEHPFMTYLRPCDKHNHTILSTL